ncbi:HlyD family efflux transporter periplasmic adaptor subunit [Singulisphaera sp. Ch08]|uniref:HlyD family efflux transporter periplasmic adaptor subunit n=1 Tax=Singulisphaera sp. Ch08 TaxID=3120278 RepID=A0AAU7CRD1_9BACT
MARGIPLLAQNEAAVLAPRLKSNADAPRADDPPSYVVKPGKLGVTVEEGGLLEATQNQDVFCQVAGQTVIISIVPDGTRVAKGELVCELDSAALKDQLTNQYIATSGAEAAYQNAKLTQEVAEIAVAEYTGGIYPQELQTVKAEIAAAEMAIQKAEVRKDRTLHARKLLNELLAVKRDNKTVGEVIADLDIDDRLEVTIENLAREKIALELAKVKQIVLEKFTSQMKTKELQSDVEKAKSNMLAKEQTWDLEKKKQAKLEFQIKNCRLLAPGDGVVVYANDTSRFGASRPPQIEEGAVVRERQKIFSLPDLSRPLRVNVKIPDSVIEWVTRGLSARIKLDEVVDKPLVGTVEGIAPLPDPSSSSTPNARFYTAHITIEDGPAGLIPGMTAQVEIRTPELENVLYLPVPSVVYYDRSDHVAVKNNDGGFEWRKVTLGLSDGYLIEVKEGLQSGEVIALEPAPLLNKGQKFKISISPPRPAPQPRP